MSEENVGGLGVSKNFNPTYTGTSAGVLKTEGSMNELTFQFSGDLEVGDSLVIPLAYKSVFVEATAFVDSTGSYGGDIDLVWINTDTGDDLGGSDSLSVAGTGEVTLTNTDGALAGENPIGLKATKTAGYPANGGFTKFTVYARNTVGTY